MKRSLPLAMALLLAGCAGDATPSSDPEVLIRITNTRSEPLQCRMMFGHWVDRDLGVATIGGGLTLKLQQQAKDGALYIMRDDGERRMMIENIFCARDG